MSWMSWWQDADWVVRGVFLVLILLSMASWTVLLYKARRFAVLLTRERQAREALLGGGGEAKVAAGAVAEALLREAALVHGKPRVAVAARMTLVVGQQRLKLENGLAFLATVGNSAPFIGLFGTVWGIMHALQGLGAHRQLSMDMVAGPVAEALVATAAGLFAAVPAVMGYNYLVRRLRCLMGVVEGNALGILERVAGE